MRSVLLRLLCVTGDAYAPPQALYSHAGPSLLCSISSASPHQYLPQQGVHCMTVLRSASTPYFQCQRRWDTTAHMLWNSTCNNVAFAGLSLCGHGRDSIPAICDPSSHHRVCASPWTRGRANSPIISRHRQARADLTVSLALLTPTSSLDPGHVAMPLLPARCSDYGCSHPGGHRREPEVMARNFLAAQFTFPMYQVMREYA